MRTSEFLATLGAHPALALAVTGFVAFAESLLLVGTFVPAAVVMLAAGVLVGGGHLSALSVIAVSVVGAIVGDVLSYEIGRSREATVRNCSWWRNRAHVLSRGEEMLRTRGAWAIVLARFSGPLRAFVPVLAGVAGMQRARFYAFNVLSALVWAPAHILPGALLGGSLQVAESVSARLAALLVLLLLVTWSAAKAASLLLRRVAPVLVVGRRLAGERNGAVGVAILTAAAGAFMVVLVAVKSSQAIVHADLAVFQFLQGLRTAPTDRWMVFVSQLGSVGVLAPLTVAVAAFLLWKGQRRMGVFWLTTVVTGELLVQALKFGVARARPLLLYTGNEQYSFPSGHVSMTTIVLAALAVLLARSASPAQRAVVGGIVGVYVGLVGLSRMYLGAHWFSDVAGGVLLGAAWVCLMSLLLLRNIGADHAPWRQFAWTTVLAIVVSGTAWSQWRGPDDAGRYAQRPTQRGTMSETQWLSQGWESLPDRREEIAGEREEAFAVQISCSETQLLSFLATTGWQPAPRWTARSALHLLTGSGDLERPVLPMFHVGTASQLQFVAPADDARMVLRLWRAPVDITKGVTPVPLWYGSVDRSTSSNWPAARRRVEMAAAQLPALLPAGVLRQAAAREALLLRCTASVVPI